MTDVATTGQPYHIEQEVTIRAPRAKVYDALVRDVNSWWAFRGGLPGAKLILEPHVGGRFFEDLGDGEGMLHGTVTYLKRPEKLRIVGPLDAQAEAWAGFNGPGLFVRDVWESSALRILPLPLAAPIVALAAFGWAAWDDPAGLRVAAAIASYAIVTSLFAGVDADWALMATPLLLVGLTFLPDALRDLVAAAMDTRRVRVQRITR